MQVNLYYSDKTGKLHPIEADCDLPLIPRIGETVSIGNRQARAKVIDIEYLIPRDHTEVLVGIILDRAPIE